jgi:hypothetical protein
MNFLSSVPFLIYNLLQTGALQLESGKARKLCDSTFSGSDGYAAGYFIAETCQ